MKTPRPVILSLLLGACLPVQAQEVAPLEPAVTLNKPLSANRDDLYHLDTSAGFRHPLNGDYDWVMPATISFGKMLDEHNSLDAVFGGGVIRLKPGSAADAQAHEPFFLELGIAWQYYLAAPDAAWKPYVTAGASGLWMTWEYRSQVDSSRFGLITRDYLEGADGYAGLGLKARLPKHWDFFGEIDVGGVGFLSTTYSGEHNNLFANFGYVGFRGGFSLKF
jgi:hypothetical protein